MKIAVVLHDYLPRHAGGSENHAHQTARELARRGHEVTALFTERDLSVPEGQVRRGALDGVRTVEIVHQREYEDLRETWTQERSLASVRGLVAELAPDVVHFHHVALWGSSCLPAARAAGARVVVTLHDYWALCDAATLLRTDGALCTDGFAGRCADCLRRHPLLPARWGADPSAAREALYLRAAHERFAQHRRDFAAVDRVIAPSRFLAERFAQAGFFGAGDCDVFRYGYPGPLRAPRRRAPSQTLRVGFVGGLYPAKGAHVLVEAFAGLQGVDAELHVHGHLDWFPDYAADLRARARGGRVRFHGAFEPGDVDNILAGLDVLAVPSLWYENMPITIYEAFRNGLPVIASDLGGMAEALGGGAHGLLFPRGDAAALGNAVRRLAADPALYARLADARPEVPTLESVVDRLERFYAEAGSSPPAPARARARGAGEDPGNRAPQRP